MMIPTLVALTLMAALIILVNAWWERHLKRAIALCERCQHYEEDIDYLWKCGPCINCKDKHGKKLIVEKRQHEQRNKDNHQPKKHSKPRKGESDG